MRPVTDEVARQKARSGGGAGTGEDSLRRGRVCGCDIAGRRGYGVKSHLLY